jgi:hypothetical protein
MTTEQRPRVDAGLPRTLRFLIAATRGNGEQRQVEMSPADWEALPDAAHRHGLSALLPDAIADSEAPSAVRERAAVATRDRGVAGLKGMAEAIQVLDALRAAGIRAVSLKGPALSRWLYGNVGFRRFADLDILVGPSDVTAACEALERHGYHLPDGMTVRTAAAIYRGLGAWPLAHGERYPVDLHFRLSHRSFAAPLSAEDVIAARVDPGGRRGVSIPSSTHAALLLLGHASKHLWCTLEMLLGIARVMVRDDVDWTFVRRAARRAGGWTGCSSGLGLAGEMFAVRLPADLASDRPPLVYDSLRRTAQAALLLPEGVFADRWQERRAHKAAIDRWTGRLRYDVWRLLAPTPAEWGWWPLPDALSRFYMPVRLARLGAAAARSVTGAVDAPTGTTAAPLPPDGAATPSTRGVPESRRTSG